MIYNEDCLDSMRRMDPASVDLVITSPPYAGKRKDQYPAPDPDDYVEWITPRIKEIHRILKPTGSFILNIKEGTKNGQRQLYVYELVLSMHKHNLRWADEYVWIKSNPFPGIWPNRLKDGWERLYHFTKSDTIKFYRDRLRKQLAPHSQYIHDTPPPSEQGNFDRKRSTGSGRTTNSTRFRRHNSALPSNVLRMDLGKNNMLKHAATFPIGIPEFFIKLLTDTGDTVYDPFAGSGTSLEAAHKLNRRYVGSEINTDYYNLIRKRMGGLL